MHEMSSALVSQRACMPAPNCKRSSRSAVCGRNVADSSDMDVGTRCLGFYVHTGTQPLPCGTRNVLNSKTTQGASHTPRTASHAHVASRSVHFKE